MGDLAGCLDDGGGAARLRFHRPNKSISVPGQGLDVAGILRVVAQCVAESQDRRVDAMLEVNESVSRPEFLLEFFPRYDFPGMFEECGENLERPFTQLDLVAAVPKLARPKINLEVAETNVSIVANKRRHGGAT
jgi:hypothetical protein